LYARIYADEDEQEVGDDGIGEWCQMGIFGGRGVGFGVRGGAWGVGGFCGRD